MIPRDFHYVTSTTVTEAIRQYLDLTNAGKATRYYGGGTEIITLARIQNISMDAVIDIKPIPAMQLMTIDERRLVLGAGVTLSQLTDSPLMAFAFPLLQSVANEIADKTARNKITLGGNLCGSIFYREAVLPFLVCDSKVHIAGPDGGWERSIHRIFQREMQLKSGEFIVQLVTDEACRFAPYVHVKRRKAGQVGYPVVTAAAIRFQDRIRIALSGVCPFPFRSSAIENALNRNDMDVQQRIDQAIRIIPQNLILDDYEASSEYRIFVLRTVLSDILHQLGGNERD